MLLLVVIVQVAVEGKGHDLRREGVCVDKRMYPELDLDLETGFELVENLALVEACKPFEWPYWKVLDFLGSSFV